MVEQTTTEVEVDGVEYEVTVDADGSAEAEPVSTGPYLVGESDDSTTYGFKIPLEDVSPDTLIVEVDGGAYGYATAWDDSVNEGTFRTDGANRVEADHDFSAYAGVDEIYITDE